jgi:TPR repeat protein
MKVLILFTQILISTFYTQSLLYANDYDDLVAALEAYQRKDYLNSFKLYQALADKGNSSAQTMIGLMYLDGLGTLQNYSLAKHWLSSAAEKGDFVAQNKLGDLFRDGTKFSKDYKSAIKWYKSASIQGSIHAQLNLGMMFELGLGTTKNYQIAHMWYNIASRLNSESWVTNYRNSLETKMTSNEVIEAQRYAEICFNQNYKYCDF